MRISRLSVTVSRAALASLLAASSAMLAFAQEPADWRGVASAANETYWHAVDVAEFRRKSAENAAGDAWLRGYRQEIENARGRGDAATLAALSDKVAKAQQAGKVSPDRPADAVAFGAHTYALVAERLAWHDAKRRCEAMGGHLVTIESAAEERFLIETWGTGDFAVGAEAISKPGAYLQLDGSPFKGYAYKVVADNPSKRELIMTWSSRDKRWNDHQEGARRPFVCEWD